MATNVGTLSVELEAKIGRFVRNMSTAEGSLNGLAKGARSMATKVAGSIAAVVGLRVAFSALSASVTNFADFEQAMVRVGGLANATGDDFERLKQTALELGATTEFTATEAAQGMTFLAMAGQNAEQIIGSLPAAMQLASAAGVELAGAADIVTNVMSAFGLSVSDLNKVNDTLVNTFTSSNQSLSELGEAIKKAGPLAKNLGLSVEDVSAALGVLADSGLRGGEAGRGLRRVMAGLAKPTDDAKKAFKTLGISITTLTKGNFEQFVKQLQTAKQKLGGVKFAAETLRAFDVFGGPIAQSLADGEASLKRVRDAHLRAGKAAELQKASLNTLKGEFTKLESSLDGLANAVGEALAPAVQAVVQSLRSLVDEWRLIVQVIAGTGDPLGNKLQSRMNKTTEATAAFSAHLIKAKADLELLKKTALGEAVGADLSRANVLIAKSGESIGEALQKAITRVDNLQGKLAKLNKTARKNAGFASTEAAKAKKPGGGGGGGLTDEEIEAQDALAKKLAKIQERFRQTTARNDRRSIADRIKREKKLAADLARIRADLAASAQGDAPGVAAPPGGFMSLSESVAAQDAVGKRLVDSIGSSIGDVGVKLGSAAGNALGKVGGASFMAIAGAAGGALGGAAAGSIVSAIVEGAQMFADMVQQSFTDITEGFDKAIVQPLLGTSSGAGQLVSGAQESLSGTGQLAGGLAMAAVLAPIAAAVTAVSISMFVFGTVLNTATNAVIAAAATVAAAFGLLILATSPLVQATIAATIAVVSFGAMLGGIAVAGIGVTSLMFALGSQSPQAERFGAVLSKAADVITSAAGGIFQSLIPLAGQMILFAEAIAPVIRRFTGMDQVVPILFDAFKAVAIAVLFSATQIAIAFEAMATAAAFVVIGFDQLVLGFNVGLTSMLVGLRGFARGLGIPEDQLVGLSEAITATTQAQDDARDRIEAAQAALGDLASTVGLLEDATAEVEGHTLEKAEQAAADALKDLEDPIGNVAEGLEKMNEELFNVPRVLSVVRARLRAVDPMGGGGGGGGAISAPATGSLLNIIIENFNSNADNAAEFRAELQRESQQIQQAQSGNPNSSQIDARGFG